MAILHIKVQAGFTSNLPVLVSVIVFKTIALHSWVCSVKFISCWKIVIVMCLLNRLGNV